MCALLASEILSQGHSVDKLDLEEIRPAGGFPHRNPFF